MLASIIIPTYQHCDDLLKPCLESIKKHTNLHNTEIIVVANGCTDGTKEYVESLGQPFKLIWMKDPAGYTKATNEGIKEALGDYVILLNNDTVLLDQQCNIWMDVLLEPFSRDSQMGITGPMKTFCPEAKRDFLIGFCVCIKRSLFGQVGLLDEVFSPGYGEDCDFCCKLEDAGYKIEQVLPTNDYYGPNQMKGQFPIYHIGNVTFKNWPGGEELLAKNNKILRDRYVVGKPNIERAKKCDGFINEQELRWLGKESLKRRIIVEIGSWHGRSSRSLGDNLIEGGVIYCVDTWKGSAVEQETNHASAKWLDGDHAFYEFLQNNLDLIEAGKIIPLRMASKNAAALLKEKGVQADMIFIDASHEYKDVCEDIDAWKGILSEDGIFCGHDYHAWAGVDQAVHEKLSTFNVGVGTTIWYCNKKDIKLDKPAIFDCFPFFNEIEVLKIRLEELWDNVDRFIICEAYKTHSGKNKQLNFQNNLHQFEKYLSKITYLVVEKFPDGDSWTRERFQRDYLLNGLKDCKDNDIIILSDLDEIPRASKIKEFDPKKEVMGFEQNLYYYDFTCRSRDKWDWAKITTYKVIKEKSPCGIRYTQTIGDNLIKDGGWHFSYFGDVDQIVEKIESTAHVEYNTPELKNKDRVKEVIREAKDVFGRPLKYDKVPIENSLPKTVFNKKSKP